MNNIIKFALDKAFDKLLKQVPKTKKIKKSVNIEDVKPINLFTFMKQNNIPENAEFFASDEEGFLQYPEASLCWEVDVLTTDKDKEIFKRQRFTNIAWQYVREALVDNGYKRKGFNSALLKEFDEESIYKMYLNNEWEKLEKYYSLSFYKL